MNTDAKLQKILVVGAGAIGQTYAFHLQRGGAEVSFFIRSKYRESAEKGFHMYPLNQKNPQPVHFLAQHICTTPEEVAVHKWDYVFLCVPTTGVPELAPLIPALGKAQVVNLTPGVLTEATLRGWIPDSRLIAGVISLAAYLAPLPGETFSPPGTAFWLPPLTHMPLHSRSPDQIQPLLEVFKRSGMKAQYVAQDIQKLIAFPDAFLTVVVAAMRHSNWKLKTLTEPQPLQTLIQALREVAQIVAHRQKRGLPMYCSFINGFTLKTLFRVAPSLVPFPVETLMQVHFTKVGQQMKDLLANYIHEGLERGLEVKTLQAIV